MVSSKSKATVKKKKTAKVVPVPQPKWKHVASTSVKWESYTMTTLKEWIAQYVPAATPDDEVRIDFETTETWGYYDDVTIEVEMNLSVLEK